MNTGIQGEDHVKTKAETGWCSRNHTSRNPQAKSVWVNQLKPVGRPGQSFCGALLQQPEEAGVNGNSILLAALRQNPQTRPLIHPHPTHLQSGTTSHLQLCGFRPAPQPGTQPTPLTQSACSSSLFFRWHLNHPFEICQMASLQFSNPTHPCRALQNGQNLSNGVHGTSFGPAQRFHPHHPWGQTWFQIHQSHLCSARSVSKMTAHWGVHICSSLCWELSFPSSNPRDEFWPQIPASLAGSLPPGYLLCVPPGTHTVSPAGLLLLLWSCVPCIPLLPWATTCHAAHWTKARAHLPPHWNLSSMREESFPPSLLHSVNEWTTRGCSKPFPSACSRVCTLDINHLCPGASHTSTPISSNCCHPNLLGTISERLQGEVKEWRVSK